MKKVIGIDLGTTNSVVAFKDTAVKILRNKENEELTRSCVGFRNNEILVGRPAFQLLERDPNNTILSVKRLMGAAIKDKMVQDMISNPYYKFGITSLKGGTDDAVAVVLGGKQYTPEQISSEILSKLKKDAEERLGGEVTHAVITVPAYFTEKQKNATRVAAQLAGLKVQKLLAEPTAAAIAYGADNMKAGDSKTVMIYDFGGGTFDLSILNIVDGQYMEAGTGGDRWLGGDDLDKKLQEIIFKKVSEQYSISDIHKLIDNLPEKKKFQFEGQLRTQTENAKIQLSSANSAPISIIGVLEDENGDWIDIEVTITRGEFEQAIKPYVQRSIDLIGDLLKDVGYDIGMIDSILLVGGSSCIPLVKQMLSDKFGSDKIKVSDKPMLAVAEGAAILAHRLGDETETPVVANNVISEISYSTNHNYYLQLKDRKEKIIDKQMPLPITVSKTFKTSISNQKIVEVSLYSDVENGEYDKMTIGYFTIEEDLPVGSDIVFNIEMDLDEIFTIRVHVKGSKSKEKTIVLGRGHKDSKAFDFIASCFEKINSMNFTDPQKAYFLNHVQKEIQKINNSPGLTSDSEKWEEIGTNVFTAFEQSEKITDDFDEDSMVIAFGRILVGEYPELVNKADVAKIQTLLSEIEDNDVIAKSQATEKLKTVTDKYNVLITLFTVKMAANDAAKKNPADANKLHQMHEKIVTLFRTNKSDEAFELLNEAIELRDQYGTGGIGIETGVHLS
ncbi:MAG: Hsp70 family protein [Bacteroidia bacterium]